MSPSRASRRSGPAVPGAIIGWTDGGDGVRYGQLRATSEVSIVEPILRKNRCSTPFIAAGFGHPRSACRVMTMSRQTDPFVTTSKMNNPRSCTNSSMDLPVGVKSGATETQLEPPGRRGPRRHDRRVVDRRDESSGRRPDAITSWGEQDTRVGMWGETLGGFCRNRARSPGSVGRNGTQSAASTHRPLTLHRARWSGSRRRITPRCCEPRHHGRAARGARVGVGSSCSGQNSADSC